MPGRNLRSRKSLEGAIAGAGGLMAEMSKREEPPRKRQRRLTAHHRRPHDLKLVPALVALPAAKKQQPLPSHAAQKPKAKRKEAAAAAPPRADPTCAAPASAGAGGSSQSPGYMTEGVSVKMAPGKRIKWRGVIAEEDAIRQDLSLRFAAAEISAGRKRL